MKFKSKKLAALLASGIVLLNTTSCSGRTITGRRSLAMPEESKIEETKEPVKIGEFKKALQEQFATSKVALDEEAEKFVSSIYVNGKNVEVELVDGNRVSGRLEVLRMRALNLENFYVMDTKFKRNHRNGTLGTPLGQYGIISTEKKLEIVFEDEICVHNECKISNPNGGDVEDICWDWNIDISKCKKLWIDDEMISPGKLEKIKSAYSLESLILTSADLHSEVGTDITLELPNLKILILDVDCLNELYNVDFTKCKNLEKISFGNNTQLENLDFLSELENLKVVSFGNLSQENNVESERSFEEEENSLYDTFQTDDIRIALTGNNNFIHNISGINGLGIETLNISLLYHVSSEQLYETVRTLPNLKEIVGFEINNAEMCSSELIEYCEANNIKHPFTEKSLEIKRELQRIVQELVTEDMDNFQKTVALSKYILEHMNYDYDLIDGNPTPEERKEGWGESLYYAVIEGSGICAGYAEFTEALFTEAGVENYMQETVGHIFNLVKIDENYYQIDLTSLDAWLEQRNLQVEEHNFYINSLYYMIPVEDETSKRTFSEPYGAKIQREKNEQTTNGSEVENSYIAYSAGDARTNNTVSINDIKLISILLANGIARRTTKSEMCRIQEEACKTQSKTSPFWTKSDYKQFYESYIEQANQKDAEDIER